MEAVSVLIVIAANLHQTTRDDHYVEATDNLLITLGIF